MEKPPTDTPPSSSGESCPVCGAVIPPGAPDGMCPVCLLNTDTVVDPASPLHRSTGATSKRSGEASGPGPEPAAPALDPEFAVPLEKLRELFPDLEILTLLGAGGMGAVYRARQPRLDRTVALKVLTCPPERHTDFSLRFEREAQVLARLNHPNIVTIYDFGEIDRSDDTDSHGNLFYFVMEFVNGADLDQLIDTGELTPEQALKIVPQICDALQYAHDEGVTHRDIKPANILVGKKGRVRIADFGLAKLVGADSDALGTGLTLTGTSMGTPHYMAPEQWETSAVVDHRADIYSLGVVFYEMLTGERPHGIFDPPSRRIQVDVRLDEVVLKAMEKDLTRRYQKASEVKDDVARVVTTPTVAEPAKSGWGRAMKVAVVGGVFAALLGGGAWWWQGPEKVPEIAGGKMMPSGGDVPVSAITAPTAGIPGRLRAAGTGPHGGAADISKVADFNDVVDVGGDLGEWVALRSNGETVSFKGDADLTNIARVAWSFDHHYALIDRQGKIHFPKNRPRELSGDFDRALIVDVQLGNEHGIALTGEGRALVFGKRYREAVGDPALGRVYGTPRWPQPPEAALSNVQQIAVTQTHAATLHHDGTLSVFGWEGLVELQRDEPAAEIISISSEEDQLNLFDSEGVVWKLPLARNPAADQPIAATGKMRQLNLPGERASRLSGSCWFTEDGIWRSYDYRKNIKSALEALPGARSLKLVSNYGDVDGEKYYSLLWIEPNTEQTGSPLPLSRNTNQSPLSIEAGKSALPMVPVLERPQLEIPPALAAMKARGGRLRSRGEAELKTGIDVVTLLEKAAPFSDFTDVSTHSSGIFAAIRKAGGVVSCAGDFDGLRDVVDLQFSMGETGNQSFARDVEGGLHTAINFPFKQEVAGQSVRDYAIGYWHYAVLADGTFWYRPGPHVAQRDRASEMDRQFFAGEFAKLNDVVAVEAGGRCGIALRSNGDVVAWDVVAGKFIEAPSDVAGVVAMACTASSYFVTLDAEGVVRVWTGPGGMPATGKGRLMKPPAELDKAVALRVNSEVIAAQREDGSWLAWGDEVKPGVIGAINQLGPAIDIDFYAAPHSAPQDSKPLLMWIEPELAAVRRGGGRLRSWAAGTEAVARLELAEGIEDFVRLDGHFYPGGQRWLAIRGDGGGVTPLTDFDRTDELVSLDSHLGVLRSGELVHCWQDQRRIVPGNAIDAAVGPGSAVGFRLVLERSGSVMMMPSGTDGDWDESKLPATRAALAAVSDAVGIACDHGSGIVVRANGEVISWDGDVDLVAADPPVQDAVEVACHSGRWFALTADGNIRYWSLPDEDWLDAAPPADLGAAFALRAKGTVCAAQLADGSWRAWGSDKGSGLIDQIESIGPAVDLQFYSSSRGLVDTLVWIEPDDESAK